MVIMEIVIFDGLSAIYLTKKHESAPFGYCNLDMVISMVSTSRYEVTT